MLAIRLPAEIESRLEVLAKATGRTKTFYARQAILQNIEDLEDIYLAETRLETLRAGRTKTISLDDVEKELGLAEKVKQLSSRLDRLTRTALADVDAGRLVDHAAVQAWAGSLGPSKPKSKQALKSKKRGAA